MQSWQDKQVQYQGSNRMFHSGCSYNSGAKWNWVGFSGTDTGFGTHGNEECNRFAIASSGNSIGQLSFNSGTSIHSNIYAVDSLLFDGMMVSGCWLRTSVASQKFRVWGW